MKRATLLLAVLAGCSSSTTFSPGASNGATGAVGASSSAATSGTSGAGSTSGGSSSGSTSGASTGSPAGGSMAANLTFAPQTVVYTQPSANQVMVTAYEHAYACSQLANATGQFARLIVQTGSSAAAGVGQYWVNTTDGGPSATFVEGQVGDGGQQTFFTATQGNAQLTNAPPASPLNGDFSVSGTGPGGANTLAGSFAANACP